MRNPLERRELEVVDRVFDAARPFDVQAGIGVSILLRRVRVVVRSEPPGLREALRGAVPGFRVKLIVDAKAERPRSLVIVRELGKPLPDDEVRSLILAMCEPGNQDRPAEDLAQAATARLQQGDPPREVGEWLLEHVAERKDRSIWWLRRVLDDS